jgi:hypothetical protein
MAQATAPCSTEIQSIVRQVIAELRAAAPAARRCGIVDVGAIVGRRHCLK